MVIAREVTDYLLNSLDKDILNSSFLRELKDYLVKYNNLENSLTEINLNCKDKDAKGCYVNKIISCNQESLLKEVSNLQKNLETEASQVFKNIVYLQTIMHEIVHSNQNETWRKPVKDVRNHPYEKMIFDSHCVRYGYTQDKKTGKYSLTVDSTKQGLDIYQKYHDIFPDEFNANAISALYLIYLLHEYNDKEIIMQLMPYLIYNLSRGYKLENERFISPASQFYELANLGYNESILFPNNLNLKEKYEIGLVDNEQEIIDFLIKEVFRKDVCRIKILNCFKKCIEANNRENTGIKLRG